MQFVRALWGNMDLYFKQIEVAPRLDEQIIVWGKSNFDKLVNRGYKCILMSEDEYDYTIAANHTFIDHSSLIHKLLAIDKAVELFEEIVFIDWDCYLVKDLDDKFNTLLRNGNDLQVPLYVYPASGIDELVHSKLDVEYFHFFSKLKRYLVNDGYELNGDHVIPNTGFVYCRNKQITERLIEIAKSNRLETVPDELAVLYYAKELELDLEGFIKRFEPSVINGKNHTANGDDWNKAQTILDYIISKEVKKDIYFHHV